VTDGRSSKHLSAVTYRNEHANGTAGFKNVSHCLNTNIYIYKTSEAGLLSKWWWLAEALGVTKFIKAIAMILVPLCNLLPYFYNIGPSLDELLSILPTLFTFLQMSYLNEEVNRTEPSFFR
jgi:hypothetical protein